MSGEATMYCIVVLFVVLLYIFGLVLKRLSAMNAYHILDIVPLMPVVYNTFQSKRPREL
jgi:hypothetical protein